MRQNNIETAREFLKGSGLVATEPDIKNLVRVMIDYHTYLTAPDSEGEKSAEEVLIEIVGEKTIDSECQATIFWDDALKAMHEFAAQSRPQLTDEEIENESRNSVMLNRYNSDSRTGKAERRGFEYGAKWARTKLTGK